MKKRNFLKLLFLLPLTALLSNTRTPFELKKSKTRHHIKERWMNIKQSFHYFDYDDPEDLGYGELHILDDFIIGKMDGTPIHPHKDMEILTVLLEGRIFHQDSLGHSGLLQAGQIQLMSAGSGLKHAETNPSRYDRARGLQIWITPSVKGVKPLYQQKSLALRPNSLELLVSPDGTDQSLKIHQKAWIYQGIFTHNRKLKVDLQGSGTAFYIFMISGEILTEKTLLKAGDGLGIRVKEALLIDIQKQARFILFEIAL